MYLGILDLGLNTRIILPRVEESLGPATSLPVHVNGGEVNGRFCIQDHAPREKECSSWQCWRSRCVFQSVPLDITESSPSRKYSPGSLEDTLPTGGSKPKCPEAKPYRKDHSISHGSNVSFWIIPSAFSRKIKTFSFDWTHFQPVPELPSPCPWAASSLHIVGVLMCCVLGPLNSQAEPRIHVAPRPLAPGHMQCILPHSVPRNLITFYACPDRKKVEKHWSTCSEGWKPQRYILFAEEAAGLSAWVPKENYSPTPEAIQRTLQN